MTPKPEAHIELRTIDGQVIRRRLANVAEPLVDCDGFYRTAGGGRYHPATEDCQMAISIPAFVGEVQ
jgi:hypothetical protein